MFKRKMRIQLPNRWSLRLLAIWFIASGLMSLLDLRFEYSNVIMGFLALAAGVAILRVYSNKGTKSDTGAAAGGRGFLIPRFFIQL
jgi:hypothetical protein